jgi:hypothetical protein
MKILNPNGLCPFIKLKISSTNMTLILPIAKSAGFFRKAPPKEKCFAVFGPQLLKGE